MKNIKVAISGNIGSGKSTLANYLKSKDYPVINSDNISKKILSSDEVIKQKVKDEFGNEAYTNSGVNKKFLAEQVFSSSEKLSRLNSILHPEVLQAIDLLVETKFADNKIIFIESAIVYEAGLESEFDYVVLVIADFDVRLRRSIKEGSYTENEFSIRDRNQIPDEQKEKKADFIFLNNDSKESLYNKADLLLLTLNSI